MAKVTPGVWMLTNIQSPRAHREVVGLEQDVGRRRLVDELDHLAPALAPPRPHLPGAGRTAVGGVEIGP
jgi:hypothetical protein